MANGQRLELYADTRGVIFTAVAPFFVFPVKLVRKFGSVYRGYLFCPQHGINRPSISELIGVVWRGDDCPRDYMYAKWCRFSKWRSVSCVEEYRFSIMIKTQYLEVHFS